MAHKAAEGQQVMCRAAEEVRRLYSGSTQDGRVPQQAMVMEEIAAL